MASKHHKEYKESLEGHPLLNKSKLGGSAASPGNESHNLRDESKLLGGLGAPICTRQLPSRKELPGAS